MPGISFVGAKKRKIHHPSRVFRMSRQAPGATQLVLNECGRLSLVDELVLNIIDLVDCQKSLCNLAATCTRFQRLVEPYIWRSLLVLSGGHARKIAQAFDSRDARVDCVQEISIRYQDRHKHGIEELNHFIQLMSRLRHLTIESPCPNNTEWRTGTYFDGWSRIDYTNLLASSVYPRAGLTPALPMLQSCKWKTRSLRFEHVDSHLPVTLHGHGPDNKKFKIERRAAAIFLHPTLRNITISCLNFDVDMTLDDIPADKHMSTPLQTLTLIETNVNVCYLDVVLSLPKALKELSINERLHSFRECEPSMDPKKRTSSTLFLTALQRQKASLKKLVHIGGLMSALTIRETDVEGSAKLRSLTELEHLELGFESHLYYYLRNDGFPPSLKTLKMMDTVLSLNARHNLGSLMNIVFHSITSLVTSHLPHTLLPGFTLHLMFSETSVYRLSLSNMLNLNHLLSTVFLDRRTIYEIAKIMKSHNARFCITRETFASGMGYIPPYMYGEEIPTELAMYDSDDFWRFNSISYQAMDDEEFKKKIEKERRTRTCQNCITRGLSVTDCHFPEGGMRCSNCEMLDKTCETRTEEDEGLGSTVAQ